MRFCRCLSAAWGAREARRRRASRFALEAVFQGRAGGLQVAVDAARSSVTIARQDGRRETLDLTRLADRHVRPGWVSTIHKAQGATAERVVAHLESFRANTVDAPAAYVAISRAKAHASIYTDSRADLTRVLGLRDGEQVGALDHATTPHEPGAAIVDQLCL